MYNSTIQPKRGECVDCVDGRQKNLIAGRCQSHYSAYRNLISQQRISKREADKDGLSLEEKELQDLVNDLDAVFSRWLRLSNTDKEDNCECFTCGKKMSYKVMQCGHYIGRSCYFLRFDTRNTRVQCKTCNEFKNGNISEYTKRLEQEHKGITEILMEESRLVYKPSRDELRQMIAEYSSKIDVLKEERKTITNN